VLHFIFVSLALRVGDVIDGVSVGVRRAADQRTAFHISGCSVQSALQLMQS
jgi:hypothetical protein